MSHFYFLYTDGASKGNPGKSGAGFALYDPQHTVVYEGKQFLGHMTNNQAEYMALILGLEKASEMGISSIIIRSDSQLMVRQLTGEYKIKDKTLYSLMEKIRSLLPLQWEAQHIPREKNTLADRLANLAIT